METQPYFRIEDERPGALLRVAWCGAKPSLFFRWAPLLVACLLLSALAVLVWAFFGDDLTKWQENGQFPGGDLAPLGIIVVVGVIMSFQIAGQVAKFCQDRGQWNELTWDRHRGTFTALYEGAALARDASLHLPLDDLQSCRWTIGPESGDPLQLTLQIQFSNGRPPLELRIDIDQIDRRTEAFDFLLRAARVAGHSHYVIHHLTPHSLQATTHRDADSAAEDLDDLPDAEDDLDEEFDGDEEGDDFADEVSVGPIVDPTRSPREAAAGPWQIGVVSLIPALAAHADYRARADEPTPAASTMPVRFDRDQWTGEFSATRLSEWKPGERVELVKDGWPSGMKWGVAAIGGGIAAFALAGPLFGIALGLCRPYEASRFWVAAVVFVVVTLAVRMYLRPLQRRRRTTVDWRRGSVVWQEGVQQIEATLRDVEKVTVGAPLASRLRDPRSTPLGSHADCEVQLVLRERAVTIAELDNFTRSYEESIGAFHPFALALAQSLGVPCRVLPRAPDLAQQRRWRPNRTAVYVFATIMALVVVAQGHRAAVSAFAAHHTEEARTRLAAVGVKLEYVDRQALSGDQTLQDFWRAAFPDGMDDARLAPLLPDLAAAGRVYLDLHGTAVTDVSVRPLGQLGNLVGLDLSGTSVTTDGADQFYRLNDIEFLDLSNTRITDNGVSICAMTGKLKVLKFDNTYTTDACMLNLRICPSLKYVSVQGTQITAQGEKDLRDSLPEVRVVGVR
ncbi:MAG: hypothetical protein U0939_18655 [Pirellulales bacterium]